MTPHHFKDATSSEVQSADLLNALFDHLREAETRCEAFTVRPGSALEADDRATAYDPISYQVEYLLVGAFDYLGLLRRTLEDHGMPVVAAYPLMRAALEAAAYSLWLTSAGTRKKRVCRALHLTWDSESQSNVAMNHVRAALLKANPAARHLPAQPLPTLVELRRRLDGLLDAVKGRPFNLDSTHASPTTIVIESSKKVQIDGIGPIDVWRLCSSMAHGNRTVSRMLLERRLEGPMTELGGQYLVTTSFQTVTAFVSVIAKLIDAAQVDRERLNLTNEPGRRPTGAR